MLPFIARTAVSARPRFVFLLSLVCSASFAQNQAPFRTYRSPDGAFELRYPASFVRCSNSRPDDLESRFYWAPDDCTHTQADLCGNVQVSVRTQVCLAFPRVELKGRRWFQSAAIYVAEVPGRSTTNECLQNSDFEESWVANVRDHVEINGAKFKAFEVSDHWAGGGQSGTVYRSFHSGTCYELSAQVVVSGAAMETQQDVDYFHHEEPMVRARLTHVLHSFRFLK
jgi:hypothetical protein